MTWPFFFYIIWLLDDDWNEQSEPNPDPLTIESQRLSAYQEVKETNTSMHFHCNLFDSFQFRIL